MKQMEEAFPELKNKKIIEHINERNFQHTLVLESTSKHIISYWNLVIASNLY